MGMAKRPPTYHVRSAAILLALSLVATACGSRLDREEHLALNSNVVVDEAGAAAAGDPAAGTAGDTSASRTTGPSAPSSAATGQESSGAAAGQAGGAATNGGGDQAAQATTSPREADSAAGGGGEAGGGEAPPSGASGEAEPAAPQGGEPTGPATLSPVTIGNIGTYSGIAGAILQAGQEGLQVWASWANQNGGLGGHQINLLTQDDAGDPSRAQSLVRDMVENQGAIAMVGNLTVFTTASYRPILEQNQVPLIGGDLLTADYFESPMMFPQGSSYRASVLGTLKIGVDAGKNKLGVIYCSEVPPICDVGASIMENDAEAALDAEMLYSVSASLAQPDFTSECLGARDAGVTNLQAFMDGNAVRRVIDSCTNQGYTPLFSTNTVALTDSVLQSPNVNGLLAGSQVFPAVANDTPGAKKFQQAYADYAGKAPTAGSSALAWTAGRLAQKAAAALPQDAPTAQDFVDGLATIQDETLEGLTVPLTFSGGSKQAPDCVFRVEVKDGKFVAPNGSDPVCF